MTQTANHNTVPPEFAQRAGVRSAARAWVQEHGLLPPLPLSGLQAQAVACVQAAGYPQEWQNYTAIMISNALWEPYLRHIPRSARLLLLPFCLRNQEHCQASYDELGLLCAQCGHCRIAEFSALAEQTGINVLVAESSSSVAQWIESSEIQAVIGVSCMASLEKAFPSMNANAVPGLAIPLLTDGCRNSTFDLEFLLQALALEEEEPLYAPWAATVKQSITQLFTSAGVQKYLRSSTAYLRAFPFEVEQALCSNGKHYRPHITAGIYCALANTCNLPEFLIPIILSVECFHKASLIHDDIEDDDDTRYGQATLHRRLGVPIALNIGDFLIGEGYRLLGHESVPADIRAELLAQAAQAHCELSLGQAQEFEALQKHLTLAQCLETYRLKTAPAFRVALYLGAIAAGQFTAHRSQLQLYADSLGVAYQLSDDLEDEQPNPASAVDCIMLERGLARSAAVAEITRLYAQYRSDTFALLEKITDPVLKTFLYRVTGKVLKDV